MNSKQNIEVKAVLPTNVPSSKFFSIEINGSEIEIGIIDYTNRLFIILTQFGKIGSLISVRRTTNTNTNDENREVYELKTIFGDENLEYHVTARALAESINIDKPILFSLALKDVTLPSVPKLGQVLLDHKIW